MSLAHNILIYRKKKFLSAEDLAQLIGVTKQSVYDYEKGKHVPSKDILEKIAEALDVTVSELYAEELNKKVQQVVDKRDDVIKIITNYANSLEDKVKSLEEELAKYKNKKAH